ncbi:MAG: hypothetical protein IPJ81_17440 [Chitinophagaceae bacterium]|nr:hypothetical protein [Chitinophagaceae bacterium]
MNTKIILLMPFLLLSNLFVFSQHRNAVPKDSIAIWELKKVAHPLGLDSLQAFEFLLAHKIHFSELDNINKSNLGPDKRKLAIEESKKAFNNRLKNTFTKEQYDKYREVQQKNRQQFIQQQKEKKVTVVEITDNDL